MTKVMCDTESWTDYRLILSKLNIRIHQKCHSQGKMTTRRINVNKLELFSEHEQFVAKLEGKLSQHTVGNRVAEKECAAFRDLVYSTAFAHLGQNTGKYQE